MTITTLLGVLVSILTVAMTVDKFMHTFGLSKLLAAQVRHSADGAVAKAALTPDKHDDEVAAALQLIAHKAADAYESGDAATALAMVKNLAEHRAKG